MLIGNIILLILMIIHLLQWLDHNIEMKFVVTWSNISILYPVTETAHWQYKDQIPQQSKLNNDHK